MPVIDAQEHRAAFRQRCSGAELGLGECFAEVLAHAHHFAGGAHLRAQCRVHSGELAEREHRRFHEELRSHQHSIHSALQQMAEIGKLLTHHQPDGDLWQRHSGGFADVGNRAGSSRVHFQNEHLPFLVDGVLHVHQTDDFQRQCQLARVGLDGLDLLAAQRVRGQNAGTVAGVNTGFFNVLHDAGDKNLFSVAKGVDIHFDGVFQEPVDQYGPVLRDGYRFPHVAADRFLIVGNHHAAAAQHVAGPDQNGKAEADGDVAGLLFAGGGSIGRRRNVQIVQKLAKAFAVFRKIDIVGVGSNDGHAQPLQRQRKIQRRLSAELHNHAVGFFGIDDVENLFQRKRFEVETVAGVVVGGNGLGVAVDHDRLDAEFLQRERCVAATVVELNSLPDAVRTAAQNHHLLAIRWIRLALGFVAGIEIRREAFEFRRAGIHAIEHRRHTQLFALRANFQRGGAHRAAYPFVGDTVALGAEHGRLRNSLQLFAFERYFQIDNLFQVLQKPRIDARHLADLFDGVTAFKGEADIVQAIRIRRDQALRNQMIFKLLRSDWLSGFQAANSLPQRLFKRPSNGHHFAHGFHLRAQHRLCAGELLKLPTRDLRYHVIDGRLKARRSHSCDVVPDLIQTIANR